MVTFAAIGKSDWPRAAIEREGGKRAISWSKTKLTAKADLRFAQFHKLDPRFARTTPVGRRPLTLTLTLSREGRGQNHQRPRAWGRDCAKLPL